MINTQAFKVTYSGSNGTITIRSLYHNKTRRINYSYRTQTAAAADQAAKWLESLGYTIVTIAAAYDSYQCYDHGLVMVKEFDNKLE